MIKVRRRGANRKLNTKLTGIREKITRPIGSLCKKLTGNKKAAHAQMIRIKITSPIGNLCKRLTGNKKAAHAQMTREKITKASRKPL
jgi:hypothetical protein